MRLLVLGGSGFLGGYVLREAALARAPGRGAGPEPGRAARTVAACGARPLAGDLDDARRLDEAFAAARCEALVCLASLGFGHGPAIVAAAEEAGLRRAVFVSTTAVTTTLHAPTRQIRLAAEQQIRGCGLDWTILRPTMIYGDAGDRNLSRLLLRLSRAAVLPRPAGRRLPAAAGARGRRGRRGAGRAASGPRRRAAVRRGRPEPLTFAELLRTCARAVGQPDPVRPRAADRPLVLLARGYERISRHPRIRVEQLRRLAEDKAFAIDDAVRDLGYAPRPFADGIARRGPRCSGWPHDPRGAGPARPHRRCTCGPARPRSGRGCAPSAPACASSAARGRAGCWPARTRPRPSAGRTGSGRRTPHPRALAGPAPSCGRAGSRLLGHDQGAR